MIEKDAAVRILDTKSRAELYAFDGGPGEPGPVAWSRDARQLAVANAHGWVYRFERNSDGKFAPARKLPRFAHAQNPGPGAPRVTALAFSPDGKTLATGGTDGAVFLWRL
jgi:WD40 repeat protein